MNLHRIKIVILVSCLLISAGCSSSGNGGLFPSVVNGPFKVESLPSGADVYVMGEKIGITPMMVSRKDVFPNIYPHDKESLYGKVMIKKEGCFEYTRPVSAEISSKGLHAKLDCTTNKAIRQEAMPGTIAVAHDRETVEQRLEKIKDLLGKGLITEEEASKARERILNDL